jgi:hypothetical protein
MSPVVKVLRQHQINTKRFRIVVGFPPEAAISLFWPGVSSCGSGNGAPFQNDGPASRLADGESAESCPFGDSDIYQTGRI